MFRNRPVLQMVCVGVVGVAILLPITLFVVPWWPTAASEQAHRDHTLYDVLLIATVPIFVIVVTVVGYCVWRFRMKPGEEERDGPPIHGNTRLEVVWTALPAVLILGMCGYSYAVLRANESSHAGEMNVNVTARQFAFEFSYPQSGGKQLVSSQLYLPKGRPVVFHLRSFDVVHSFFVPEFSVKLDAVPGIVTTLRVTPNRIGTYPAECTELCGAGHSLMRGTVHVVTPATFNTWLSHQKPNAPPPIGAPPANAAPSGFPGASASASLERRRLLEQRRRLLDELGRLVGHESRCRQGDLHRLGRLRDLPHPVGRGHHGHGRSQPDPAAEERLRDAGLDEDPRQDAHRVHPHGDHRPVRLHTKRLPRRRDAVKLRKDARRDRGAGARQLPFKRDKVRYASAGNRNPESDCRMKEAS